MTSRYLGLVVVPGEYIVKIEVEEFVSQLKGKKDGMRVNGDVVNGNGSDGEGEGGGRELEGVV